MTDTVDRTIAALRANHEQLAEVVAGLDQEQLIGPSAASDWTVADVLSHLGSGDEIQRYAIEAATGTGTTPPSNQEVWDRWNAMAPADQASGFLGSDEAVVAAYEALTPEQRESTMVDLGFLPQPVPVVVPAAMRLNEQTLHGWDVRVAVDPTAGLGAENAELLAEHMATTMSFMLGFTAKPEGIGPARVDIGGYTLVFADGVTLEPGATDVTATFHGPLEAAVRLLAGRLKAPYIADGLEVTGNVTLADLQQAFRVLRAS